MVVSQGKLIVGNGAQLVRFCCTSGASVDVNCMKVCDLYVVSKPGANDRKVVAIIFVPTKYFESLLTFFIEYLT